MPYPAILKPESLRDQVFALLKTRVIVGEMAAESICSAAQIAAELGVSTSPVREALLSLVDLGLMAPVKNRGFRVLAMDEAERRDLARLRVMIELPAMVALIPLAGEISENRAEIEALMDAIEAAARTGDLLAYLVADRAFHITLLAYSGNRQLLDLVNRLRDQTRLSGLAKLSTPSALLAEAQSHRALFAALLAQDRAAVEELMLAHMLANLGPEGLGADVSYLVETRGPV